MTVKDFFQKTIVQVAIGAAILVSIGLAANYAYTEYDDRQFKAYMQERDKWIEIKGLYWSATIVFGLVREPCPLETGYRPGDEPLTKFVYQPTEESRKYTAMALEKYNNDPETELKITEEELEDFLQNHMDEILDENFDVANKMRAFLEWGSSKGDYVWCEGNSKGKKAGSKATDISQKRFGYAIRLCRSPEGKLNHQFAYEYAAEHNSDTSV